MSQECENSECGAKPMFIFQFQSLKNVLLSQFLTHSVLVFEEVGKPEYPAKILSEQRREPSQPYVMGRVGIAPGQYWCEATALTSHCDIPAPYRKLNCL